MIRELHNGSESKDRLEQIERWPVKYGVSEILRRLGKRIERKDYWGTSTPEVISGFEDLIDEPLGADLFYNTQGTAYQLAFAISLSSHPALDTAMAKDSKLSSEQTVQLFRREKVLSGLKIMDLGSGLPVFALAAKALGAEVYTADAQDISVDHLKKLSGHVVLDLNDKKAPMLLKRKVGSDFDLVTEHIVGQVPSSLVRVKDVDPKTIEHIAASLLKQGGYLYRPGHLSSDILRKK